MNRRWMVRLGCWLITTAAAGANTFLPSASFAGDTRAVIAQTGTPWRCVGRLELPDHRFMTASLVGPDLILTAAHGLVRDGRFKPGSFVFRPDSGRAHHDTPETARATCVWIGSFTPDQEPCVPADWAILRLDRNLGDTYGALAVRDMDDAMLAREHPRLYLASYDRDFGRGHIPSWEAGGSFVAVNPVGYLLHDFSTDNGASGAPVFYFPDWDLQPGARIVALNVAEKTPHGATLYRVPFSIRVANVAVASHRFYPTLARILAGDLSDVSYVLR